jgi:hypothetical protein
LSCIKFLLGDAAFCQKAIATEPSANERYYLFCLESTHETDLAIAD